MNQAVKVKPVTPKVKPEKKKKARSLDKVKARSGWAFIAPFVLIFFMIYVPVIIDSVRYSFSTIYPIAGGGFILDPVGFSVFRVVYTNGPEPTALSVHCFVVLKTEYFFNIKIKNVAWATF